MYVAERCFITKPHSIERSRFKLELTIELGHKASKVCNDCCIHTYPLVNVL